MNFWIREVAGWILVVLGLLVFYECLGMLLERDEHGDPAPRILEAGPATVIGIIIFRGGIHLLKVAVAARVCLQAQEQVAADRAGAKGPSSPKRRWGFSMPGKRPS